jgi:hypothetical protein
VGRGPEFEGAVIALVHFLLSRTDKTKALKVRGLVGGAGVGVRACVVAGEQQPQQQRRQQQIQQQQGRPAVGGFSIRLLH